MSSADRVLFALFNLIIVILSAYVMGTALGWLGPADQVARVVFSTYQVEAVLLSLVIFFLGLRFLYMGTAPGKDKQQPGFVHDSELGQIKVSLEALEQVAEQAVAIQRGVRQAKIQLQVQDGGASFRIRVATNGQQNLVELARSLQAAVKEQVEKVTNVRVLDVVVVFSKVGSERVRPL
jgi:hypothetical protein